MDDFVYFRSIAKDFIDPVIEKFDFITLHQKIEAIGFKMYMQGSLRLPTVDELRAIAVNLFDDIVNIVWRDKEKLVMHFRYMYAGPFKATVKVVDGLIQEANLEYSDLFI